MMSAACKNMGAMRATVLVESSKLARPFWHYGEDLDIRSKPAILLLGTCPTEFMFTKRAISKDVTGCNLV